MTKRMRLLTGFAFAVGSAALTLADSATMKFEQEGFDLETGTVHPEIMPGMFPPEVDFHFAYNAITPNHIRLFQEYPAEVAFLDGTPFVNVTCTVLPGLTFTKSLIDEPFDYDDTFAVKTELGNYFKVGEPVENAGFTVTFAYEELFPASKGDLNCDGEVNFDDIDPFVLALGGKAGYLAVYPNCNWLNADCNCDGMVDFDDIDPFVALLSNP